MPVCFRNINGKVYRIFHAVIPIARKSHQISTPCFAFRHIAHGFLDQLFLSQNSDDENPLFHQADGAVFQLTGRISLRVDIGNLFHFQASFQADGIIQTSSDKEDIVSMGIFRCKPLDTVTVLQYPFHFIRQSEKLADIIFIAFLIDFSLYPCHLHRKHIHCSKLCTVGLGCSYCNFGSGKCIQHMVSFPCNGRSHNVHNSKCFRSVLFRFTECCQRVRRFSRLGDNNYKIIFSEKQLPVPEFRSKLNPHRYLCEIFQHILRRHADMPRRSTRRNINRSDILQQVFCKSGRRKVNYSVLYQAVERITDGFGLLMNLFDHEMLIARLFSRCRIPFDLGRRKLNLITVQVKKVYFPR